MNNMDGWLYSPPPQTQRSSNGGKMEDERVCDAVKGMSDTQCPAQKDIKPAYCCFSQTLFLALQCSEGRLGIFMRNVSNWSCRYLSESNEWEYLLDTEGRNPCRLIVMWEIQTFSGVTVKRQNRNGTGHPPQYFPEQVQQTQTNLWVCCCLWGLSGIFTLLNCAFQMQTKLFTHTDETLNYWIELEWDDPSFSLSTLYLHAYVSRSCFFSVAFLLAVASLGVPNNISQGLWGFSRARINSKNFNKHNQQSLLAQSPYFMP